ncbi:MAG: hypothetical protein ACE5GX_11060 [Thermoanaerobaculia bacterium]
MSSRRQSEPLAYSAIEINSYLPSGWNLEATEGEYLADKRRWQIEVEDVSEMVSTLAVKQADADKLGRIPALQAAIDRLYRKA